MNPKSMKVTVEVDVRAKALTAINLAYVRWQYRRSARSVARFHSDLLANGVPPETAKSCTERFASHVLETQAPVQQSFASALLGDKIR